MGDLKIQPLDARYDDEAPGPYCLNHRSVFCTDAQTVIAERYDADLIGEVIGRNIGRRFQISFPIYPLFCIWETLTYEGVMHDLLGPIAELTGGINSRHKVVHRILPGESASDLGWSLRESFEAEVEDKMIELTNRPKPIAGQPDRIVPRCKGASHSMRYQQLVNQMLNPSTLADPDTHEQAHALMWCYHYQGLCLFCWTKSNMSDAIRVSPDFAVDPYSEPSNHDDLVVDPRDTNRRSSAPPW